MNASIEYVGPRSSRTISVEWAEEVALRSGWDLVPYFGNRNPHRLVEACVRLSEVDTLAAAAFFAFQFSGVERVFLAEDAIRQLFEEGIIKIDDTRRYGFWSGLPSVVVAYRGVCGDFDGDPRGTCWTLSRAQADWYANRWPGVPPGRVVRAEIPRERIAMAHHDRRESELVVPWFAEVEAREVPGRSRRPLGAKRSWANL